MREKEIIDSVMTQIDEFDADETTSELEVMSKVCEILDKLPPDVRTRIVAWLNAKYAFGGVRDPVPTIPDIGEKRRPTGNTDISVYAAPGPGWDFSEQNRKFWTSDK
jgi:hypothetical protein